MESVKIKRRETASKVHLSSSLRFQFSGEPSSAAVGSAAAAVSPTAMAVAVSAPTAADS